MRRRSYLFVPGDRPERFQKALDSGADAIILDLEDAVSANKKPQARQEVVEGLLEREDRFEDHTSYVRVNAPDTEWFEADIEALAGVRPAGIVLPDAEKPDQLEQVRCRIPGARLVPIVESAIGVWDCRSLAEAPNVERLAFGDIDFRLDAGIEGTDVELLYARSRLVLACRVSGIAPPLDSVTSAMGQPERLAIDVDRAVKMGFGGKLCIHPEQVAVVNKGFSASEAQVDWARRVLEATGDGEKGAVRVDGEMVDYPVIKRARAIVQSAES